MLTFLILTSFTAAFLLNFLDINTFTLDATPSSGDTFVSTVNGQDYLAKYITAEDVERMKQNLGSKQALPHSASNQIIDGHGTGYLAPSLEELDSLIGKTTLLEPIEDENTKLGATADISTEMYFPAVGNQASQGSCTAWAVTYYAYGYLEAKDHSWDASSGNPDYLLSPAWAYNKVATANDDGSSFSEIAQVLLDWGVPTLSAMPYDDTDVDSWGDEIAYRQAPYHRPLSHSIITYTGAPTISTIISLLDSGTPVTFAIDAYQFSNGLNEGTSDFILSSDEYNDGIELNHAQCIVGYDDGIIEGSDVGAFRVVNSWGDTWMDGGYYWLTYNAFDELADDWWLGQVLMYITDRADYNPDLIATWEFSTAPTRMNDILTLGVGPQIPMYTKKPLYENDPNNIFPSFMALDISAFNSSYTTNNDVFFFLEIGSSTATGTISSFRVERYFEGVLQEISPESPGVPEITPCRVNTTFMKHDLRVVLEVPTSPIINYTYLINAKVINNGLYNETGIYVELLLDGEVVASTIIPKLLNGSDYILDYNWTANSDSIFNFTAQAPPISGETYISNNQVTKLIQVWESFFHDDFESGLSKWDSITGLWHLTSDSSAWPDPCYSPTHSMWFGDESIGTYNTGFIGAGELTSIPFDLTYKSTAFLEFYHWREAEGDLEYDVSKVYISTDGMIWDELYVNTLAYVPPWSKVSIDLSPFIGNSSIQIRFHFIIGDLLANDYRGWLVDDVAVLGLTNHHDLSVSMDVPENPEIGNSYMINATVTNIGATNEDNINFFLYLNGEVVNSTSIPSLNSGANFSINYNWTPSKYGIFNFTAHVPPITEESFILDNFITKISTILLLLNYTEIIGIPYSWIDASGGTELTLADNDYEKIHLPFIFPFYNQSFSNVYLSENGYLSFTDTTPFWWDFPFPSAHPYFSYMIAPFWDDLFPSTGGHIYIQDFGDHWVAEWIDYIHHSFNSPLIGSFEVVLYDTGEIMFNYDYINYTAGGYTCGLNLGVDTDYYNSYTGLNDSTNDFSLLYTYELPNPPDDFTLTSDAGEPDLDGVFELSWLESFRANNYSVYAHSSYITTINGSLTVLADEITDLNLALTDYLDGTYYYIVIAHNNYGDTLSNCLEITVEIPPPPGEFTLSSNAGDPDTDGDFDLEWTASSGANNYSIYEYSSYITAINGSLTLLGDEITDLDLALTGYLDGTYYFIVVAHNDYGDTLSNCLEINIYLDEPPGEFILTSNAGDPDDDGTFDLTWTEAMKANNYSVYAYSSYITTINGSLTLLGDEITDLNLALIDYLDRTYYFIIVAHNDYGDTLSNCLEITVEIPSPPGEFTLSSNAGNPDTNGNFDLQWTTSPDAISYSLYHYSSYITDVNTSLTVLANDITDLNFALTGYENGVYYFIVVASNIGGETFSNCLKVTVQKSSLPGIPGYNLLFLIATLGATTSLMLKKKLKTNSK